MLTMQIRWAAFVLFTTFVSATSANAATLNFPAPSGSGSAVCAYASSSGCFTLPDDFLVFINETGLGGETVDRQFEFTYPSVDGGSVYKATINPDAGFAGEFKFGEVDIAASNLAGEVVLAAGAVTLATGSQLLLSFMADVLYGLTVVGTFGGTFGQYDVSLTAVPLPPALILFLSALAGLGFLARRKRTSTGPELAGI